MEEAQDAYLMEFIYHWKSTNTILVPLDDSNTTGKIEREHIMRIFPLKEELRIGDDECYRTVFTDLKGNALAFSGANMLPEISDGNFGIASFEDAIHIMMCDDMQYSTQMIVDTWELHELYLLCVKALPLYKTCVLVASLSSNFVYKLVDGSPYSKQVEIHYFGLQLKFGIDMFEDFVKIIRLAQG